jgi:hypothetical protein
MNSSVLSVISVVCLSFLFSSCGGGWDEESKLKMKETCTSMMSNEYAPADAASICECYVSGLVEKYPKADFNPDQNYAEMMRCSGGYKSFQELKLEEATKQMMQMEKDSVPPSK